VDSVTRSVLPKRSVMVPAMIHSLSVLPKRYLNRHDSRLHNQSIDQ